MTHPYAGESDTVTPANVFTPAEASGGQLVKPVTRNEIEALLAPYTVDMRTWLRGITSADDYPDADPEAMAMGMLAQIPTATTSEEALAAFDLSRAKDMCGNEPGGKSPVLEITGARPMKSTFADGAGCYVIVSATVLAEGRKIQFTTGAKAVQMMIWKHTFEGWLPFRAMLEIRREKTAAGYHPLNLVAGI